ETCWPLRPLRPRGGELLSRCYRSRRSSLLGRRWRRFRRCLGLATTCRLATQNGVHLVAFESGHRLGDGDLRQCADQPLEDAAPDFRMRHLAAAEENRRLDLVTVLEEALDVLLLELVVVFVHLGAELDLFDFDDLLVLPGLARPLLFLVL